MSKIEDEMRGLPSLLGSNVTSLVLDGCGETLYAALDSGLFSALARLESLSLRCESSFFTSLPTHCWSRFLLAGSRRPYQSVQPPPLPVVSLPRLKHLCLLSSEVSETIKGIFASAEELESLELYGVHSWTHSPQSHLELLQHTKQLKKLLLSGTGSLRPTASAIASLPSLERLTLEGAFDLGDISAAQEIGKAPTSHIVLIGEHYISPYSHSVPFLLSLVEQGGAPDSRRSLQRLTLNAFTARKGPSAKDVDFDPWEFDARHKPIFTGVMRRTYIEQFISDFEEKGLVVNGTALKAVKYDRFHDDERAKLKAFLRETGDERGEGWLSDTDSEYEP
jgi:hypothetical protein